MINQYRLCSANLFLITVFFLSFLLLWPPAISARVSSSSTSSSSTDHHLGQSHNISEALKYKLIAICSVLFAGAFGICIPFLVKNISYLNPEREVFFLIKAFAAGVILATGFVHILPDAFDSLTSPYLSRIPWENFPFAGFVAMLAAIGVLMMESSAIGYHKRFESMRKGPEPAVSSSSSSSTGGGHGEEEIMSIDPHEDSHGGANGSGFAMETANSSDLIRHRIVSQVLELGIVVHSVIIGLSLGASKSSRTIKPLVAALSFHQFFEGMGLGGCLSQARFKTQAKVIMIMFFSLTTPIGIAIGIWISKGYKETSPTALIVQGILNSASAGILIYMSLVDLLAADFMKSNMLSNLWLQIGANLTLLLGTICMSLLAWEAE